MRAWWCALWAAVRQYMRWVMYVEVCRVFALCVAWVRHELRHARVWEAARCCHSVCERECASAACVCARIVVLLSS